MHIRAFKLRDERFGSQWFDEIADRWEYDDFRASSRWRQGWISFDSLLYCQDDERVYCGITSFDADIFYAYDRRADRFLDLGYRRIADPFDAKFHRSLLRWQQDGCLYAGVALLHDVDRYWEAPGGAIVRYDPRSGQLEKCAVPLPHLYIQALCLDQLRGVVYGITFTPERMFRFDLASRQVVDLGPISSGLAMAQGENIALDDEGCVWCGWSVTRAWQASPGPDSHRLCKFDPRLDRIRFFDAGLPRPDGAYGYVKVEGLFCLGPDRLYASGGNGSLYRVDPDTGMGTYLGTPVAERRSRLAALCLAPDGFAYGVTGRDGHCELLRLDPASGRYALLGPLAAGEDAPWQVHDIVAAPDGTLYAAENDNPYRSGYLWEIRL